MKYYAMIDGRREGPFSLEQLPAAGVAPDTYVWCKGMDDWQKAGDLPDICRLFRNRLLDLGRPEPQPVATPAQESDGVPDANLDGVPVRFRRMVEESGLPVGEPEDEEENIDNPPKSLFGVSIFTAILFLSPVALIAAIYYYRAKKKWSLAMDCASRRMELMKVNDEVEDLRKKEVSYKKQAYNFNRIGLMLLLMSFFVSLIMIATAIHLG